jgi:hypothetical protein
MTRRDRHERREPRLGEALEVDIEVEGMARRVGDSRYRVRAKRPDVGRLVNTFSLS